jgi:peptide/nickel transport system ATP-binding protein
MEKTIESRELLDVKDLYVNFYTYAGVVEAIDGVNLLVKQGETLGLVGETGCGKSVTSLSIIVLVPPPGVVEKGDILLNMEDRAINLLKQRDRALMKIRGADISMVFQDPRGALNPVYTVTQQVGEALLLHRKEELCKRVLQELERDIQEANTFKRFIYNCEKKIYEKMMNTGRRSASLNALSKIPIVNRYQGRIRNEIRKEVVKLLKTMKIADPERVADMYPHELSGGMAQRVVIAMALSCDPRLLLADEPTTNLDVTIQAQILLLIKELKEKMKSSILYVTHDLGVVAQICDRVAVMYAGNVVEVADTFTIFKKPSHPYTQDLLQAIPRPGKEFKSIRGEVPALINPPKGCRYHPRCSKAMPTCAQVKPQVAEIEKGHLVMCHLYKR